MAYVPKSQRKPGLPTVPDPCHVSEEEAIIQMSNLIESGKLGEPAPVVRVMQAAMYAAKTTLAEGTPQRVFVQDFAAILNRRELLSNTNVQPFREYGYQYMRGHK